MKYVIFENKGEIDLRMITTFGISVKETENPIGFFGTGLKYAIAILARFDADLTIQVGTETYHFIKATTEIRGKKVELIEMNGMELPFTTHLGVKWELWQAFREIYCNCIDESGVTYEDDKIPVMKEGITRVIVKHKEFYDTFKKRHEIVLNKELSPQQTLRHVEIYSNPSQNLYYRGIRVANTGLPAMFTYNVTEPTDLTEDRTVKYESSFKEKIIAQIASSEDPHFIKKVMFAPRDTFEHDLSFACLSWRNELVSDVFMETLEQIYESNDDAANRSAINYFRDVKSKRATKVFEPAELDEVQQFQLTKAIRVCLVLYPDFEIYPIEIVKDLGQNTMALALSLDKKIIVSKRCFDHGTKFLVSTLIEEYTHLKTGYEDYSRDLQTYIFDQICTITERFILKEPI